MPRHFSQPHPRAVRSLYTEAEERWLIEEMKTTPRPWQRAILLRAFEVDEDDRLCWRVVVVSVGRQSGKTWLIRMLTNLRQRLFAHIETQEILHLARIREAARSVIVNEAFARWAKSKGIVVRSSNGQEQWRWPDDSIWDLSSLDGAYGRTAGLVLMDETWDVTRRQYFEGVQPTMAAREQAQVWFFSAAHREATELTPLMIQRAKEGRDGYALFDWGAQPGDDLTDPDTWRRMGPHWDKNREAAVLDAVGEEAFAQQWANIWPDVLGQHIAQSPVPNWGSLKAVSGDPPFGCLVALDEHVDGSGASVAAYHEGAYWYREVDDIEEAVAQAQRWTSAEVLVGFSLRHAASALGLPHVVAVGAKETSMGTPLLLEAVRQGEVAHEHSETLAEQAAGLRTKVSDAGVMSLSVRSSKGSVVGMKLLAWMLWHERNRIQVPAAIW